MFRSQLRVFNIYNMCIIFFFFLFFFFLRFYKLTSIFFKNSFEHPKQQVAPPLSITIVHKIGLLDLFRKSYNLFVYV